jgi:hypothetical protein
MIALSYYSAQIANLSVVGQYTKAGKNRWPSACNHAPVATTATTTRREIPTVRTTVVDLLVFDIARPGQKGTDVHLKNIGFLFEPGSYFITELRQASPITGTGLL